MAINPHGDKTKEKKKASLSSFQPLRKGKKRKKEDKALSYPR